MLNKNEIAYKNMIYSTNERKNQFQSPVTDPTGSLETVFLIIFLTNRKTEFTIYFSSNEAFFRLFVHPSDY